MTFEAEKSASPLSRYVQYYYIVSLFILTLLRRGKLREQRKLLLLPPTPLLPYACKKVEYGMLGIERRHLEERVLWKISDYYKYIGKEVSR